LANDKRLPRELGAPEVEAFLTDLAVRGKVSASTQNQALSALLFGIATFSRLSSNGWTMSSGPVVNEKFRSSLRKEKQEP